MNDFFETFKEVFEYVFPYALPLICLSSFSITFSVIKRFMIYDFSFSHNDSNLSYEDELLDYLDDSPVITIDNLYSNDKEYLVDYYCKHLSDYI